MWKNFLKSMVGVLFSRSKNPDLTLSQSFEALASSRDKVVRPQARSPYLRPHAEQINELKRSPVSKLNVQEIEVLAREYFRGGEYLEQDKTKAASLWAKGCKLGSISCCYNYATLLRQGVGISKDEVKSFDILLELANEHRHAVAHYDVAVMASLSIGRKKDDAFIFNHFYVSKQTSYTSKSQKRQEAANGGVVPAMYNVGSMYARGIGVDNNDNMALKYYEMAAYHGDANAMYDLGAWFFAGRAVSRDTKKSFEYYLRAAHKGHHGAAYNVAVQYMQGDGVSKDIDKAAEWYEKAGNAGMPQAWYNLAKMHLDGMFGDADLLKVKEYLLKGAALRDNSCASELLLVEQRIKARELNII